MHGAEAIDNTRQPWALTTVFLLFSFYAFHSRKKSGHAQGEILKQTQK
jgi:hypothetical protein